jgi:predicted secreted protein
MRLSTGLAAAMLAITPVADGADGRESQDGKQPFLDGTGVCGAASGANDGSIVSLAQGMELAVALRIEPGSGCCWRVLQFDSAVLQRLGEPQVQFEPKPDRNAVGFFLRKTFRFRAKAAGETGLAFGYFRPGDRTPPERQVRILVRTG